MELRFSEAKNDWLIANRGVSFDDVIEAISEGRVLRIFEHPNQEKYPGQQMMVINIDNYPYCVPFSMDEQIVEFKTVYPSRRYRYLVEGQDNG
jgi:uncharacterized DUF497 family protein